MARAERRPHHRQAGRRQLRWRGRIASEAARLGAQRVGHGGTLDPLATGVLAICVGRGDQARVVSLLADDKGLRGRARPRDRDRYARPQLARWSRRSHTITSRARPCSRHLSRARASTIRFRRCNRRSSRAVGAAVQASARRRRRSSGRCAGSGSDRLELRAFAPPKLSISIACSKGTYVRSLVSDLGADLGCGAHLSELRRTRSEIFRIEQAQRLGPARSGADDSGEPDPDTPRGGHSQMRSSTIVRSGVQ